MNRITSMDGDEGTTGRVSRISSGVTGYGRPGKWAWAFVLALLAETVLSAATSPRTNQWFRYFNDVMEDVPWSIHVVKIERGRQEYEFCTTLGRGDSFGMATVSEQIRMMPADLGEPVAAINGDFYRDDEEYQGRPRDIQIRQGEVVSTPSGHTSFWIDAGGNPHMTNISSAFRVSWMNGMSFPVGLNEARADDAAVLYTSVVGSSTRARGGLELILEPAANGLWLPLRVGQVYDARVGQIRASGDTPLRTNILVLSLGPDLAKTLSPPAIGNRLRVITETRPDLSGAQVALGGGPALVSGGKIEQWRGLLKMRHPRAALGWNKEYIFLVEVDGRQSNLSVGMTFPELAAYMAKLGCEQAMNLDGGGSATLWVLGDVRNSPSEGDERPAANALVVLKKRSPGTVPR